MLSSSITNTSARARAFKLCPLRAQMINYQQRRRPTKNMHATSEHDVTFDETQPDAAAAATLEERVVRLSPFAPGSVDDDGASIASLDRDRLVEFWLAAADTPPLTVGETAAAVKDLLVDYTAPISACCYRRINRKFVDPGETGQPRFALFSYVPSAGSRPDEDGTYGVFKIRGAYDTVPEATNRCEQLIRNIDSNRSIFICRVGVPYPIVAEGFALDVKKFDVEQKVEQCLADDDDEKRAHTERVKRELEERKAKLLDDVDDKKPTDAKSEYITKRLKLAQLQEHLCKLRAEVTKCRKEKRATIAFLRARQTEDESHEREYFERYMEARREAHIPEDTDGTGFMPYMKLSVDALDSGDDNDECDGDRTASSTN